MENVVANVGDILVVENGLLKFRVVENVTNTQEKEYLLVSLDDYMVHLWSKELHFKVGDAIFEGMAISCIIPKQTTDGVTQLLLREIINNKRKEDYRCLKPNRNGQ